MRIIHQLQEGERSDSTIIGWKFFSDISDLRREDGSTYWRLLITLNLYFITMKWEVIDTK